MVAALCKPALCDEAFVAPATARDIAADLVVTEAAVKQHLLRLYQKLKIAEGPNRRVRLANEVVARGLVRPLPVAVAADGRIQAGGPSLPAVPTDAAQLAPQPATPPPATPQLGHAAVGRAAVAAGSAGTGSDRQLTGDHPGSRTAGSGG